MGKALTLAPKAAEASSEIAVSPAIESEDEYDRMVAAVEQLTNKGEDRLSPEESALLETMAILVQAHDDRHHPLQPLPPHDMLGYLMETSGRTTKDLLPIFATRGRISEVLSGKRSISKEQARNSPHF
jgi:HTH-type transcriptional regulator/antitoxin HigA